MLLVQNKNLLTSLKAAIRLYNKGILARIIPKNRVTVIISAVVLSIVYLIHDRILKPPKNLRHIPYFSYIGKLKSIWERESVWDRSHRLHLPLIESDDSKGLFLEMSREGWVLQVANLEGAKQIFLKPDLFPKIALKYERENTLSSKFATNKNILMSNGAQWKAQRKAANPAFHRAIPVNLLGKLTLDMFKSMESMDNIVNVSDLAKRYALDAIGKAAFGFDFDSLHDKDSEWVHRYNYIGQAIRNHIFFLFPYLDSDLLWMFPERQKAHKEMKIFLNMIDKIIIHKREMIKNGIKNNDLKENEKDLLDLLIESEEDSDDAMSNEDLKNNLCVFFVAGHDTTANALSFAIHYLAENQEIQQKAREEVVSILGDEPFDVLPTIKDTKNMIYLNQIIKETLRINSPVTKIVSRIAVEDTILADTFIPKGTILTVNLFDLQHSKKIWKDANKFDPDRFSVNKEGSGESMAWLPFGYGARQCIGMNFSMAEQRVMLSMLLRKFIWSTPKNSKHKDSLIIHGVGVIGPEDLDITFCKRY